MLFLLLKVEISNLLKLFIKFYYLEGFYRSIFLYFRNRNVNCCLIGRWFFSGIDNVNVNIFGDLFGGVRNLMIFSLDIWDVCCLIVY